MMKERFIGEAINPGEGAFDFSSAAPGEPGVPRFFKWRGENVEVAEVLDRWKGSSLCTHGSGERYVREHWYEIRTPDNRRMKIFIDRQPHSRNKAKRWWLYSIVDE